MVTHAGDIADRLATRALYALPPETAHDWGTWAMAHRLSAPGPIIYAPASAPVVFGVQLPNPLGLAAGFDKNARLVDAALDYGFGFVEVGSVTFGGGPGNPKPRLFRLDPQTLMNRMGLNGDPAAEVAERLARVRTPFFAVNIAKTHSPQILGDLAIHDIVSSYRLLRKFGIYTAVNISCPNTREGRTFEEAGPLKELLAALSVERKAEARPLVVKLSPVLDPQADGAAARLDAVLDACEAAGVDGYLCCNTLPGDDPRFGAGGISGSAVRPRAWRIIDFIRARLKRPIIGCGGVFTRADLSAYLQRGCVAVQAYNGFVRGPTAGALFAHRLLEDLGT